MTTINDAIQQYKNVSGIFKGAGGDRIPPHGPTHAKDSTDPIPQQIDGIPVDLDSMVSGEAIVLGVDGVLSAGTPGGSTTLQSAYANGAEIVLADDDLELQVIPGKEFRVKDGVGNAVVEVSDIGSISTVEIAADVVTLKDANLTAGVAISESGNIALNTTAQSIIGAVNEVNTSQAAKVASITVDKTLTKTGTATAPALAQSASIALTTSESLLKTNGSFTGSTDSDGVSMRDTTLLSTKSVTSRSYGRIAIGRKYIAAAVTTGGVAVFDRKTQVEIAFHVGTGVLASGVFIDDTHVAWPFTGTVRLLDVKSGTYEDKAISGMRSVDSCSYHNGNIVIIDNDNYEWVINTSDWTYMSQSVTGLTNEVLSISQCKSGGNVYFLDGESNSGGEVFLRKKVISSGSITTSVSLGTTTASGRTNSLKCVGNYVFVFYSLTSTSSHKVLVYDLDLTLVYTGSALVTSQYSAIDDGVVITVNESTGTALLTYQLPSLTRLQPDFVLSLGGGGLSSAAGHTDVLGNEIVHSKDALMRSVSDVQMLNSLVAGLSVQSVVSTFPTQVGDGKWYLLTDGRLICDTRSGWRVLRPIGGMSVFQQDLSRDRFFDGSMWTNDLHVVSEFTTSIATGTSTENFAEESDVVLDELDVAMSDGVLFVGTAEYGNKQIVARVPTVLMFDAFENGTTIVDVDNLSGDWGVDAIALSVENGTVDGTVSFKISVSKINVLFGFDINWVVKFIGPVTPKAEPLPAVSVASYEGAEQAVVSGDYIYAGSYQYVQKILLTTMTEVDSYFLNPGATLLNQVNDLRHDGTTLWAREGYSLKILEIDPSDMTLTRQYTAFGYGTPTAMDIDDTYLYCLTDNGAATRFFKFTKGNTTAVVAADLAADYGTVRSLVIVGDSLFFTSSTNSKLYRATKVDGVVTHNIGSNGSGDDQFDSPRDLKYVNGELWVLDYNNDRIVRRTADTSMTYIGELAVDSTTSGFDYHPIFGVLVETRRVSSTGTVYRTYRQV